MVSHSAQPATTIFYDTAVDYLGITADLATFNHVFDGEDTYAVVRALRIPKNRCFLISIYADLHLRPNVKNSRPPSQS